MNASPWSDVWITTTPAFRCAPLRQRRDPADAFVDVAQVLVVQRDQVLDVGVILRQGALHHVDGRVHRAVDRSVVVRIEVRLAVLGPVVRTVRCEHVRVQEQRTVVVLVLEHLACVLDQLREPVQRVVELLERLEAAPDDRLARDLVLDQGDRAIAGLGEALWQRRQAAAEVLRQAPDAVALLLHAGEQADDRRQRPRGLCIGAGEPDAARGQAVDRRGRRPLVAPGRDVTGVQRVGQEDHDVASRHRPEERRRRRLQLRLRCGHDQPRVPPGQRLRDRRSGSAPAGLRRPATPPVVRAPRRRAARAAAGSAARPRTRSRTTRCRCPRASPRAWPARAARGRRRSSHPRSRPRGVGRRGRRKSAAAAAVRHRTRSSTPRGRSARCASSGTARRVVTPPATERVRTGARPGSAYGPRSRPRVRGTR